MSYKDLKKQIKQITYAISQSKLSDPLNDEAVQAELSTFFFKLDRNIEQVESFYNFQLSEYERRLKRVSHAIASSQKNGAKLELDKDEYEELLGILLELRGRFRNLKWFAELNKRGFIKILKKLDKKAGTNKQVYYLSLRIFPCSFASETELLSALGQIGTLLETLPPDTGLQTPSTGYADFIAKDDAEGLMSRLISEYRLAVLAPPRVLISLLNKLALAAAFSCIDKLLACVQVLGDAADVSGRTFFHHHVIALGKQRQDEKDEQKKKGQDKDDAGLSSGITMMRDMLLRVAVAPDPEDRLVGAYGRDGVNLFDAPKGLEYVLTKLPVSMRPLLLQRDNYKRAPLHYAAQYGLKDTTGILIEHLKKWGQWDPSVLMDDPKHWGDTERLTPVHLALVGDHPLTLTVLLDLVQASLCDKSTLLLAARLRLAPLLEALLDRGADINHTEDDGETALFVLAKLNAVDCVELLLKRGANSEIAEKTFGWTPVFVAAAEGFTKVVELLLKAGAVYDKGDASGYLPMEHSSLRGHLALAEMLRPKNYDPLRLAKLGALNLGLKLNDSTSSVDKVPDHLARAHEGVREELFKEIRQGHVHSAKPVKLFGHGCLKPNEKMVLVTLGTLDLRDKLPAIQLNRVPISRVHATQLDTALSVSISCKQSSQDPVVLDLPLDDNHGSATDPIGFKIPENEPATVYFDIVPTYKYGFEPTGVLGRAVALLSTAYTSVGKDMASFHKVCTVPILELDTLEELGTVRFEMIEISAFQHANMNLDLNELYWKTLITTRVIGHRGLGKNFDTRNSLQLGENTVESFIAAASLGASYVEFDVQLTKDMVPVIYHDFLVAETGVDIPMHKLTAEQFLKLSEHRPDHEYLSARKNHNMIRRNKTFTRDHTGANIFSLDDEALLQNRKFELSFVMFEEGVDAHGKANDSSASGSTYQNQNTSSDDISSVYDERMKLTRTYKEKKFKGNSRGSSIASSFVTLEDLFKKLPESVGFNIECKYPMLSEAEKEDFEEIGIALNKWVDVVLKVIYDNKKQRNIIFSSFHPDVCIYLTLKQPSIPILFLTEAGSAFMPDARASSLQAAIRFAKKWNLLGIVSAADPIVQCPRLARIVKSNGLVCFTYGVLNNDPENARLEVEAGVDAVIVDKVLAVRKGLTGNATKSEAETSASVSTSQGSATLTSV